ncbi:hypothetical protein V5799_016347 [Amblyomma americanum]|uniref:GH18 domain-containing protein n=1 Tax=Amblyomma americanum TaxID=6943 RepID=A0AAQ4F5A3_AMBAM
MEHPSSDVTAPQGSRRESRRRADEDESFMHYVMHNHNLCLMALLIVGLFTVVGAGAAIVAAVVEHFWTSINDADPSLRAVAAGGSVSGHRQDGGMADVQVSMQQQFGSHTIMCFVNHSLPSGSPYRFDVDNASAILCDALVFVSVGLNVQQKDLRFKKPVEDSETLQRMASLPTAVWACVGGEATDSPDFRALVLYKSSRLEFVRNAAAWSRRMGLAGLVLYWKYPTLEDRSDYSAFVNTMRLTFQEEALHVTVVVPWQTARRRDGYYVHALYTWLHFVVVDTHQTVDPTSFPVTTCQSPMRAVFRARHNGQLGLSSVLDELSMVTEHKLGKTMLSVSFAGATFTLKRPRMRSARVGSTAFGPGRPFRHTNTSGLVSYYEVTQALVRNASTWSRETHGFSRCSVAHSKDQWIGFEDRASLRSKRPLVRKTAGLAVWDLPMDDFAGDYGPTWPLLREVYDLVHG